MSCHGIDVSTSDSSQHRELFNASKCNMTSPMRHRKSTECDKDNSNRVVCRCERIRHGLISTKSPVVQSKTASPHMQVDSTRDATSSRVVTSSPLGHRKSKKRKRADTSNFSLLRHLRANIIPKLSPWKLLLLVHLIVVLVQINRCESSNKWWSIASIPLSQRRSANARRQYGHQTTPPSRRKAPHSGTKPDDLEEIESLLTNDKIKEILTSSDIATSATSQGEGSFANQNKRDVTSGRASDVSTVRRADNIFTKSLSGNFKPPIQLLNKKQRRLLRRNKGALEEIIAGLKRAVKECKYQFRNRRWVCQTDSRDGSLFGKITARGFRETAYIYAITSAAVTHSIARGCSLGRIASCGCDIRRGVGGPGWEWGGCSDNFKFARQFAKKFVNAGEVGTDLKYRMNLHNNEVGRRAVEESGKRFCKCHGMSGSCTLKTCLLRASDFRTVARKLRDKCDDAERVTTSNHGTIGKRNSGLVPAVRGRKPPKKVDLVYFENSPSFCVKEPEFWAEGTKGRTCNSTSSGLNGCDSLCCGRGFRTRVRTVRQKCNCEFEWCCKVKCQICEVEKEISRCK